MTSQNKLNYNLIADLWNAGEYTMQDIALKLGVSRERIRQIMIKMKIQGYELLSHTEWSTIKRDSIEFARKCSIESHKWEMPKYRRYRSKYYQRKMNKLGYMNECMLCGYDEHPILCVHHIDGDRCNNELTNLLVVCPNCHAIIHKEDSTKAGLNN